MKKATRIVVLIVIIALAIIGILWWTYHKLMAVETVQIDPDFTIYLGGGGNSVVLTSDDGNKALVVETKLFAVPNISEVKLRLRILQ